jgi:hypothetical protein
MSMDLSFRWGSLVGSSELQVYRWMIAMIKLQGLLGDFGFAGEGGRRGDQ